VARRYSTQRAFNPLATGWRRHAAAGLKTGSHVQSKSGCAFRRSRSELLRRRL